VGALFEWGPLKWGSIKWEKVGPPKWGLQERKNELLDFKILWNIFFEKAFFCLSSKQVQIALKPF
jgi:hypothetical protein